MHELSMAQAIVDKISLLARQEKFQKVLKLRLEVGAMSGVVPEAIRFCFSEVANATPLEQAELILEEIPLKVRCQECSEHSSPEIDDIKCIRCGSSDVKIVAGMDLKILDLEVE